MVRFCSVVSCDDRAESSEHAATSGKRSLISLEIALALAGSVGHRIYAVHALQDH